MPIEKAIKSYLLWKSSYAPTAAQRYQTRLSHFLSFIDPTGLISDLSGDTIIQYHLSMEASGFSRGTINYSARILRNFFEFMQGRGERCIGSKEIRLMRHISPEKELISFEDMKKIDGVLNEHYNNELIKKLIIHMLWDTGIRVSELCNIQLEDIQDSGLENIRCARIQRRKSYRYDQIVWSTTTNDLLNKYLGLRLGMKCDHDFLFVARGTRNHTTPITVRTVQRWVKEVMTSAEIDKNVSPHCFRHSKAHRVLDKSENIRDVQAILGHVSPESSIKYLHLNRKRYFETALKYL
jgi:site-specific recombinase XerD